jgi:MtN3 and saliva related transmembrane protein
MLKIYVPEIWTLIGSCAAVLTMFAFIPQIIKALKTKSIRDVSIVTLFQLTLGVLLWIAYGIHIKDIIVITANSITLLSLIILLSLYFCYRRIKQ